MGEVLFQPEHPVVMEGWNSAIFGGIEAFEVAFPCVDDELINSPLLTDCGYEAWDMLVSVMVVYSESALDAHRNFDTFPHFPGDASH